MDERIYIEKTIKNFIYYLEFEENKKYNTVISIKKDLNQFLEYLNKKNITTLDKLDELIIREYLTELKFLDLSNSTYNRRLSSIKKFYKYLINNNLKEKGKEILIEGMKNNEKKIEYLNYNEIALLREKMKGLSEDDRKKLRIRKIEARGELNKFKVTIPDFEYRKLEKSKKNEIEKIKVNDYEELVVVNCGYSYEKGFEVVQGEEEDNFF